MTSQEQQLLQAFLDKLIQVPTLRKDPDAAALIEKAVALQPNAAYLLVQRVMLLEQALNSAKTQIANWQNQNGDGGFLSVDSWGRPQQSPMVPPVGPAASYGIPQNAGFGLLSGGTGSFLGNIASTAAGVAGGAFLFQGIESLLGHHGAGFYGAGVPEQGIVENTTVNNYYGSSQEQVAMDADNRDTLMESSFDNNIDNDDSSWI